MYPNDDAAEPGVILSLMVNIARIIIYIIVMLAYLQDFFEKGFPYNTLNFLMPAYLIVIDFLLILLCFINRRQFWNLIPIVSFLAMLIAGNTAFRFLETGNGVTFLGDFLLILAVFMFVISTIELATWAAKQADLMKSVTVNDGEPERAEYRSYSH